MSRTHVIVALVVSLAAGVALAAEAPANIAAAVADPGRPATDVARDAARKPAETLTFAGIKTGEVIAELDPSGGYYTRQLSKAVGPTGKVYVFNGLSAAAPSVKNVTGDPAYANVIPVATGATALNLPEKVDLVWTTENYHDLHNAPMGPRGGPPPATPPTAPDIQVFDKAVLDALKPGGEFLVLDHAAVAGDTGATSKLHRIDPAQARAEITKAGFTFDGSSDLLKRPSDPMTGASFSLHDATNEFLFKFKKP